jgi:hypothetical protein
MAVIVNTIQLKKAIVHALKRDVVLFIQSSPGCGKSEIIHNVAKKLGLKLIDLRLSQCDPSDLQGFARIVNEKATYVPFDTFPLENDEIPDSYEGWLLFLDEFPSAPLAVQSAAYKLVLDRLVGQKHLHKKCKIICAGNRADDNAIVNRISTAMQSRLTHLVLEPETKHWIDWAIQNKVDHRILAFIDYRNDILNAFDPDHNDLTFPCSRTWASVNKLIKDVVNIKPLLALICGTVGEGAGREFVEFTTIYASLPTKDEIFNSPTTAKIPADPSAVFALYNRLVVDLTDEVLNSFFTYVHRLPAEFAVLAIRQAIKYNRELITKHSAFEQFCTDFAADSLL